jgi:hypothetical protein
MNMFDDVVNCIRFVRNELDISQRVDLMSAAAMFLCCLPPVLHGATTVRESRTPVPGIMRNAPR